MRNVETTPIHNSMGELEDIEFTCYIGGDYLITRATDALPPTLTLKDLQNILNDYFETEEWIDKKLGAIK